MKQLVLRSLRNLEDCLVSRVDVHFCKINLHVWEKIPIEGAIHLRSHSIPLMICLSHKLVFIVNEDYI